MATMGGRSQTPVTALSGLAAMLAWLGARRRGGQRRFHRPGGAVYRCRLMAPRAGFEPATIRLTVECSTAELPRNDAQPFGFPGGWHAAAYNKAFRPCKGGNRRLRRDVNRAG